MARLPRKKSIRKKLIGPSSAVIKRSLTRRTARGRQVNYCQKGETAVVPVKHEPNIKGRDVSEDLVKEAVDQLSRNKEIDAAWHVSWEEADTAGLTVQVKGNLQLGSGLIKVIKKKKVNVPTQSAKALKTDNPCFAKALEVFRDEKKARSWFSTPKSMLQGMTPSEYCRTPRGAQEVTDILVRIQYGVYS